MAYENLAYIVDGALDGSTQVTVGTDQPDATLILVYAGYDLLGSATVANKIAIINTNRPLEYQEPLIAYVGQFGEKASPPTIVTFPNEKAGSWLNPVTVGEQPYDAYLEAGNVAVPSIYAPQNGNRIAYYRNLRPSVNATGITLSIQPQYAAGNVLQCLVSVLSVEGFPEGVQYKFDSDAASGVSSKIYTVAGSRTVRIISQSDSSKYREVIFNTIMPPAVPVATTSASIVNIGCVSFPENICGITVTASVFCEVSVDGLDVIPNFGTKWVALNIGRAFGSPTTFYVQTNGLVIPTGSRTLRVREIANPTNEVSTLVYV